MVLARGERGLNRNRGTRPLIEAVKHRVTNRKAAGVYPGDLAISW